MFRKILYEMLDEVARITLNRPDKRNALDGELVGELKAAFGASAADEACRVVLLTGAGRDFCSGADLASLEKTAQNSVLDNMADARSTADLFLMMRNHPRPVIAAVQGRALAGTEVPSRSRQQRHAACLVGSRRAERRFQLANQFAIQRIAFVRTVERDPRNSFSHFVKDFTVHRSPFAAGPRRKFCPGCPCAVTPAPRRPVRDATQNSARAG